MIEAGQEPLGPFALYILPPAWIGGRPEPADRRGVAWEKLGVGNVPITALQDGIVIFEFNKSDHYARGAVPAYTLPKDKRIPKHVSRADQERIELAYRRFVYMNAFLMTLYSGIATLESTARPIQEPTDPTNYFAAERIATGWKTLMSRGREVDYPDQRSSLKIETLDHALDTLQKIYTAIGPAFLEILSLIYTSCNHYSRHQFASAHLIAWAAVEFLLNTMWRNLQVEIDIASGGYTKMNKVREKLLAGRDFSASVVSQVLSICKKIDDETLVNLDQARQKRNAFIHNLTPVEAEDASGVIQLATSMITSISGVRVVPQLMRSYWI